MMRRTIALLLVSLVPLLSIASASASGEPTFPYKAIITTDEVYVRSGPGLSHYPTDKLTKGQEVVVYRHDSGDWCAIKPTEGSFSWVSSRFAKREAENLAVVTEENVSARVGSKFSDIRDTIQVRLHKGEVVEVLETKKIGEGSSPSQTWYKIAPPSGEFRWVSLKYLEAVTARDGSPQNGSGEGKVGAIGSKDKTSGKPLAHETFQKELNRLELELSQMVVEESSVWSFDSLRIEAESLLEGAETALDRGKVRLLLNKLDRFEDIKNRADQVAQLREDTVRSSKLIAGLRRTVDRAKDYVEADTGPRFDGVGRLEQLPPTTPGVARYALLDEKGNIRTYVSPAMGVNLRNYTGQQVGIKGVSGHILNQKAQHITASQITILDNKMLR